MIYKVIKKIEINKLIASKPITTPPLVMISKMGAETCSVTGAAGAVAVGVSTTLLATCKMNVNKAILLRIYTRQSI